jgi:translation initiation factor IF-3
MQQNKYARVNFQIRAAVVRVTQDGNQLGIMPIDKARRIAQDAGLDLVEIAAHANPPVCSIMDYGKFRYEQKIKRKEQERKQREASVQIKEIRLRPAIADHDIQTKSKAARAFLEKGNLVQLNLQYKNREIAHKEQGFNVVNKILADLKDIAAAERPPKIEGNKLVCRIIPRQEVENGRCKGA